MTFKCTQEYGALIWCINKQVINKYVLLVCLQPDNTFNIYNTLDIKLIYHHASFLHMPDQLPPVSVTDRIIDLCILVAKYHIFSSKLQGTTSHLIAFVQNIKNRFEVELH